MTQTSDVDDYWDLLTRIPGVGFDGFSFLGGTFCGPFIRHAENIHPTGVLDSLIGASRVVDLRVHGQRVTKHGEDAKWVR